LENVAATFVVSNFSSRTDYQGSYRGSAHAATLRGPAPSGRWFAFERDTLIDAVALSPKRQNVLCLRLNTELSLTRSLNESSSLHTSLNTKSSNNQIRTNKAYQRQLWHALIPSSNSTTRALLWSFNSKRSKLSVSFNLANELKIVRPFWIKAPEHTLCEICQNYQVEEERHSGSSHYFMSVSMKSGSGSSSPNEDVSRSQPFTQFLPTESKCRLNFWLHLYETAVHPRLTDTHTYG